MEYFELRQVAGDLMQVVDNNSGLRVNFTRHEYNNTATVAIEAGTPAASMSASKIGDILAKISEWMAGSHYLDAMHAPTHGPQLLQQIIIQAVHGDGLSLDEIAERSGYAITNIRRMYYGKMYPRNDMAQRVAFACGYGLEVVKPGTRTGYTAPVYETPDCYKKPED